MWKPNYCNTKCNSKWFVLPKNISITDLIANNLAFFWSLTFWSYFWKFQSYLILRNFLLYPLWFYLYPFQFHLFPFGFCFYKWLFQFYLFWTCFYPFQFCLYPHPQSTIKNKGRSNNQDGYQGIISILY